MGGCVSEIVTIRNKKVAVYLQSRIRPKN